MAAVAPGTPFGRYRLLRKLAAGGMAEVYLAELPAAAGVSKELVIKKIHAHLADNVEFREMFIGEARIAVGLNHGNIAQVFDFGEVEGEYFLALEYVAGRSAAELVARARNLQLELPIEICAFIALQMCQGLHYAHTRGDDQRRPLNLVHRDISPQNVLVSFEGQVKLVDFGIAKVYGEEAAGPGRSQTASGVVKGKYLYFSPEQARAEPLNALTDVYATGAVLFEMLCGRPPFEGQMVAVLTQLLHGAQVRPSEVRADVPEALEAIVLRAMASVREHRFSSALEMQEALAGFLAEYAPRLTSVSLAELMGEMFTSDSEAVRGSSTSKARPSAIARARARSASARLSGPAAVGPASATATVPDAAAPLRPWLPLAVGGGAIGALVLLGLGLHAALGPGRDRDARSAGIVISVPSATTAPPPPVEAKPVAPPVPTPALPDRLAALPALPKAKHAGRTVAGLRCDGDPTQAEVQKLAKRAAQASLDSRLNEATALLAEAIGAEPTAGNLYLAMADGAAAALNPSHLDLILRDVESFVAACPSTRRPLMDSVDERLSDLADPGHAAAPRASPESGGGYTLVPDAPPPAAATSAEVTPEARRRAARFRTDAESLMRSGRFEPAELKLRAALLLTPADPKLRRLLTECQNDAETGAGRGGGKRAP